MGILFVVCAVVGEYGGLGSEYTGLYKKRGISQPSVPPFEYGGLA